MARAAQQQQTVKTPRFVLMASVCIVVAALYFAQDVLIPLALEFRLIVFGRGWRTVDRAGCVVCWIVFHGR
jgi:hypothetical protein